MKSLAIINALVWAAVILLVSYFLKDSENYEFIFLTIVLASLVQMGLVQGRSGKKQHQSCCKL